MCLVLFWYTLLDDCTGSALPFELGVTQILSMSDSTVVGPTLSVDLSNFTKSHITFVGQYCSPGVIVILVIPVYMTRLLRPLSVFHRFIFCCLEV